jgi:hypothetical protein
LQFIFHFRKRFLYFCKPIFPSKIIIFHNAYRRYVEYSKCQCYDNDFRRFSPIFCETNVAIVFA